MKEYVEKMKTEKAELEQRITKLLAFIESDKFAELDATEKRLLRMQYCGMETYLTSLAARLLQEDIKRYEGDVKKLNEEFDDLKTQGLSKEEVEQIMCDKVSKIQRIGDGMMDDLKSIVMSGMMFGEMQKSQSKRPINLGGINGGARA
jgi:hypothetical protein